MIIVLDDVFNIIESQRLTHQLWLKCFRWPFVKVQWDTHLTRNFDVRMDITYTSEDGGYHVHWFASLSRDLDLNLWAIFLILAEHLPFTLVSCVFILTETEKKTEMKEPERLCRADASYINFHFFNSQPSRAVPTASGHFEDYLCFISLGIHFIQVKHHVFFLFASGLKRHIFQVLTLLIFRK